MTRDADVLRLSRDCVNRVLALGLAACQLLDFWLLAAARIIARLLGSLLLPRRALGLFAFFLAQCFGICHVQNILEFGFEKLFLETPYYKRHIERCNLSISGWRKVTKALNGLATSFGLAADGLCNWKVILYDAG